MQCLADDPKSNVLACCASRLRVCCGTLYHIGNTVLTPTAVLNRDTTPATGS